MNDKTPNKARLQLALVALVFILPLAAAWWMYFSDSAPRPEGRTNNGVLLQPVVNLPEQIPGSPLLDASRDHWALVYLQDGDCGQDCRDMLHLQRQTRLMLGNDMNRVLRVLLHAPGAADTLFLDQEHPGLVALSDRTTRDTLAAARPADVAAGGLYLVDPLGNLVLYFPADITPRDLVADVEHLLELSRIG